MSDVAAHLETTYGIGVAATSEIEPGGNVFRVERSDGGPAWIARVFPDARSRAAVEGDAAVLRYVAEHGFPAERCAHDAAVSTMGDRHVLVTELVVGANGRPDRSVAMFDALGD